MKKDPSPGMHQGEVKNPEIGQKELLVKVKAAGICGTDLHIYDWDDSINSWMNLPRVHPVGFPEVKRGGHAPSLRIRPLKGQEESFFHRTQEQTENLHFLFLRVP